MTLRDSKRTPDLMYCLAVLSMVEHAWYGSFEHGVHPWTTKMVRACRLVDSKDKRV